MWFQPAMRCYHILLCWWAGNTAPSRTLSPQIASVRQCVNEASKLGPTHPPKSNKTSKLYQQKNPDRLPAVPRLGFAQHRCRYLFGRRKRTHGRLEISSENLVLCRGQSLAAPSKHVMFICIGNVCAGIWSLSSPHSVIQCRPMTKKGRNFETCTRN